MKNSFVMYTDYLEHISLLSDEDAGKLLKVILLYASGEEIPDLDGMGKMAFSFIRQRMDRDAEEYEKKVKARREAGKLGGRPKTETEEKQEKAKKANGYFAFQEKASEGKEKQNNPDNVLVNVLDNDNDKKEILTNVSTKKSENRFSSPTLDDVQQYCQENGYSIDAERFIDFYSSKGWYVGKNKMKDWKAAVRNWNRTQRQDVAAEGKGRQDIAAKLSKNRFHNFKEHEYDYNDLMKQAIVQQKVGVG